LAILCKVWAAIPRARAPAVAKTGVVGRAVAAHVEARPPDGLLGRVFSRCPRGQEAAIRIAVAPKVLTAVRRDVLCALRVAIALTIATLGAAAAVARGCLYSGRGSRVVRQGCVGENVVGRAVGIAIYKLVRAAVSRCGTRCVAPTGTA